MIYINRVILFTLFLFTISFISGCNNDNEEVAEDDIVAIVNGEKITRGQLNKNMKQILWKNRMEKDEDDQEYMEKTLESFVLDLMIQQTLVLQEAEKNNIEVSKELIDIEFEKIKSAIPNNITFEEALEVQEYTEEALREEIKNTLIFNAVMSLQHLEQEIEVTDEELLSHYKQLIEKYGNDFGDFDSMKEEIKQSLQQQKYLEQLQQKAKIKIL